MRDKKQPEYMGDVELMLSAQLAIVTMCHHMAETMSRMLRIHATPGATDSYPVSTALDGLEAACDLVGDAMNALGLDVPESDVNFYDHTFKQLRMRRDRIEFEKSMEGGKDG